LTGRRQHRRDREELSEEKIAIFGRKKRNQNTPGNKPSQKE